MGIANEKKWAYWLGVVLVALQVAVLIVSFSTFEIINLMIYVAMLALLLHTQSRNYRRIWFK